MEQALKQKAEDPTPSNTCPLKQKKGLAKDVIDVMEVAPLNKGKKHRKKGKKAKDVTFA